VSRTERRSRFGRILLVAGVFALAAMIYVPTPGGQYRIGQFPYHYSGGYRLIFDRSDTSVAFFQLVVNVAFAALLGAILANALPKIPRRVWQWTWRVFYVTAGVSILLGALCWWSYSVDLAEKEAESAKSDRDYAGQWWADSKRLEDLSEHAPLVTNPPSYLTQAGYLRYAANASYQAAQKWRYAATHYRFCNNTTSALEVEQLANTAEKRKIELERRCTEARKKALAQFPTPPIKKALPVATPTP
jgi:hypothetical protein